MGDAMLDDAGGDIGYLQEAVVQERDDEEDRPEQVGFLTSHAFTNLFHSGLLQAPLPALYLPVAPGLPPLPLKSPTFPLLPSPSPLHSLHKRLLPNPSHSPHASTQHRRWEPPQEVQGRGRVEQWQQNEQ